MPKRAPGRGAEHLFTLKQALALFDYYTAVVAECDAQIEHQISAMKPRCALDDPGPPLKARKPNSKSNNKPAFHARAELKRLVGVDVTAVTGLRSSLVLTILSEIGTDMSKWPTVKQVASWLGRAPRNDISACNVLRSRTLKMSIERRKRFATRHSRWRAVTRRLAPTFGGCGRNWVYNRPLWRRRKDRMGCVSPAQRTRSL